MAKRLTAKQLHARYEALSEAAQHLRMDWTDDPTESAQGEEMANWLDKQSLKWLERSINAQDYVESEE